MKSDWQITCRRQRRKSLVWMALTILGIGLPASAELVTVWEDQFTADSVWEFYPTPDGMSIVSQAVPAGVVGSEDGFEGRFTNSAGGQRYAIRTIPAQLIQAGDRVEYSIRTDFSNHFAGDRVNLVAPVGGTDFDSGFQAHDSTGGLTYLKEPGTYFDLFDTTLLNGLRAADNFWFGNSGYGGPGVESVFYIDYIRIVGERTPIDPDFNGDGTIDAADYVTWRKNNGSQAEYDAWKSSFGMPGGAGGAGTTVPEPATSGMALIGVLNSTRLFRRRRAVGFSVLGQ